tara:strand:- start:36 stop:491 length:456 start_codon:yes stop_codon:yes gene_type:complete
MNEYEREYLAKYVAENKIDDTTEKIRGAKQSRRLRDDVMKLCKFRILYKDNDQFIAKCEEQCGYLKNKQKKLYEKLLENQEIETLNIVKRMLKILENIENGELDQNDGSYEFGKLCKEIYVDPVINEDNNTSTEKCHSITWHEYKKQMEVG